jgi:hypothetical protein
VFCRAELSVLLKTQGSTQREKTQQAQPLSGRASAFPVPAGSKTHNRQRADSLHPAIPSGFFITFAVPNEPTANHLLTYAKDFVF